jgi:hypothetical protein
VVQRVPEIVTERSVLVIGQVPAGGHADSSKLYGATARAAEILAGDAVAYLDRDSRFSPHQLGPETLSLNAFVGQIGQRKKPEAQEQEDA